MCKFCFQCFVVANCFFDLFCCRKAQHLQSDLPVNLDVQDKPMIEELHSPVKGEIQKTNSCKFALMPNMELFHNTGSAEFHYCSSFKMWVIFIQRCLIVHMPFAGLVFILRAHWKTIKLAAFSVYLRLMLIFLKYKKWRFKQGIWKQNVVHIITNHS